VLQVISACAMSFAHGSNDIANSIGSFSAAYYVYRNMAVPGSNAEVGAARSNLHYDKANCIHYDKADCSSKSPCFLLLYSARTSLGKAGRALCSAFACICTCRPSKTNRMPSWDTGMHNSLKHCRSAKDCGSLQFAGLTEPMPGMPSTGWCCLSGLLLLPQWILPASVDFLGACCCRIINQHNAASNTACNAEYHPRCTPGSWPWVPPASWWALPPMATRSCACWVSNVPTSLPLVASAWRPLPPLSLLLAQPWACPCPPHTPSLELLPVEVLLRAGGVHSTGGCMARCLLAG